MDRRLSLQKILEGIMEASYPNLFPKNRGQAYNVYFQPSNNTTLEYPAIVYERDKVLGQHANNLSYVRTKGYRVTIMDRSPDSPIPDRLARLPLTGFLAANRSDGLHHDIYSIYF